MYDNKMALIIIIINHPCNNYRTAMCKGLGIYTRARF